MAVSSEGLRPGKAQKQLYSKLQAHPLVREGATKLLTRNCLKKISRRMYNWLRVPDGRLILRLTGRLTVGRNVTLTSTTPPMCLCGLVVRVPGYRSRGPGSIPGAIRFSEK
jgi:hypothetical protein